jgi:asparagine synthase (glutamine-hydrolysing)
MCGICGVFEEAGEQADRQLLATMVAAIRHRGPDDWGTYCQGQAGLGHARLSIIDLSGGSQPMATSDGTLWISFNGEIFNYVELRQELIERGHRFATHSDTEVILHLYQEYGEGCVEHMNGQWAFAIWDTRRSELFLSRDRLGVRPLFYTRTPKRFLFASEIKALLACPDVSSELDLAALDQTFTFWFPLPPRTAFRNILQLPPGHSMVVQDGEVRVWRYWQIDYDREQVSSEADADELAGRLLALLQDATRLRLRSDVPVGAYFSGGLDSTLTAALAAGLVGDRLRTFSVSFENAEFDESSYQQEASAFLGTQHTDAHCWERDIAEVFPEVVWHAEQPILRTAPAPMYLLARLVRESGYKVVVTGEGADEMLGGYDIFKEAKIRRFWGKSLASTWRPLLLRRLYPYMDGIQRQPRAYLERFFRVTAGDLASPFFSHLPRWELTAKLKLLLSEDVRAEMRPDAALQEVADALPARFESWERFSQAEYLEAAYLLPGYILSSQGDRMAMAHGVEGRYPFLDHRVVQFASHLPPAVKMKVLDEKHLLRRAAKGLIPESIRSRRKQPYRAPEGPGFFASRTEAMDDVLSTDTVRRQGIFDPALVAALVEKFRNGSSASTRDNMALIGILSTGLLLDQVARKRGEARAQAAQPLPPEQHAR